MFEMDVVKHPWLLAAAVASVIASLLHIAIIFGGADWYRFFGAGEGMAQMAEQGSMRPTLITLFIAAVLAGFALYAISGAGYVPALPFRKAALLLITALFTVRALAGLILPFVTSHPAIAQNTTTFWMVSSCICLLLGFCFLRGTLNAWQDL
ncbi:MAG: hypothetical protein ACFHVJ_11345 [Aestuariibacter sp.]